MQIVTVQGMTSEHCATAVSAAIHGLDPCANVAVDLAAGLVRTDSVVPIVRIAAAIESAGYRSPIESRAEPVIA